MRNGGKRRTNDADELALASGMHDEQRRLYEKDIQIFGGYGRYKYRTRSRSTVVAIPRDAAQSRPVAGEIPRFGQGR